MSAEPRPGTAEAYDRLAPAYDDYHAGPRWELYDHVTLGTAWPYLPPAGGHILDAGAGSGRYALAFLAEGYEVTLLDPSSRMLDVAAAKVRAAGPPGRARFVQGGIEALGFPDAAFDFVFCEGDPLSYCIGAEARAARELLRVLRPGRGFYVSVDNRWMGALGFLHAGQAERAFQAVERGDSADPYGMPVHAFEAAELRAMLEAAGARDVRVTGKILLTNFLGEPAVAALAADPGLRAKLWDLEDRVARDPALAGLAGHLQAVGRKA